MRFSVFLAGAVALLAGSAASKAVPNHARAVKVASGPAYPDLQARFDPSASTHSVHARGGPSRVDTAESANARSKRGLSVAVGGNKAGWKRTKALGFLTQCHAQIKVHQANIKKHCGSRNLVKILVELRAIISVIIVCVGQIKECGGGSVPSQPASYPPSVNEICGVLILIIQVLVSISVEVISIGGAAVCAVTITECCTVLIQLLISFEAQFSGSGSIIANGCGESFSTMTGFLGRFGFKAVASTLRSWN